MSILFLSITVLLAVAAAAVVVALRKPRRQDPPAAAAVDATPAARSAASTASTTASTNAATPTAAPAVSAAAHTLRPTAMLPEALRSFQLVPHEQLSPARKAALLQRLAQLPPPPLALHKLVSADFLEAARPTALAELISGEAQIAARLLASVNTPRYGLRKPVDSVVQAVSLLGLNTVRGLCLQHLLHNSFPGTGAAQRQRLDRLLHASTLGSELCGRLAVALGLPEPGALVTQGVLSFLGQLATTVLLQPDSPAWGPHASLLARLDAEQQALGLGSGELGALLLQTWGLPAGIVASVRDTERLLVTPAHLMDVRRAPRLALCYLSARIGERLASGQLADLAALQPDDAQDPDFCHLGSYLALPALASLATHLQPAALPDRQPQPA